MGGNELRGAYERLRRAELHGREFKRRSERFNRSHLDHLAYDFNSQTGRAEVLWSKGRLPSPGMSIVVGEAIYNLRAALDYLIFELAKADSGGEQDGTQFPVESSCAGFRARCDESRTKKGKIRPGVFLRGLNDRHKEAVHALQPCERCDWTARLADISNPDKHRQLTDSRPTAQVLTRLAYQPPGSSPPSGRWKAFPAQGRLRGKVWDVYVYAEATLQIEFADGTPVVPILDRLEREVRSVLDAFSPCFQQACPH